MKCAYCGNNNDKLSKFCTKCGRSIYKKSGKKGIEEILFVPKKNNSNTLRDILLIFSFFGVVSILVLIYFGSKNSSGDNGPSITIEKNDKKTNNIEWKPFTSVEHSFTISFPKYPSTERIPVDKIKGISYSGVQYISTPDENIAYFAQVGDYDVTPANFDNKFGLEGMVNGMINEGGILTGSELTKFLGYDAVSFSLTSKEGYLGRGIAFIRDDLTKIKAFTLLLFSKDDKSSDYNRFINSFKLN